MIITPPENQKTAREWHETEPDWDQAEHERDLEAAKERQRLLLGYAGEGV